MKKILTITALIWMLGTPAAGAADFLGAPVMSGGRTISQSERELKTGYGLPAARVADYYHQVFGDAGSSLKIRERGGQVWIEDFEARPWHKIVIESSPAGEAVVTITRDSWTWILTMLVFRFLGVFVVLLVLYLALSIFTAILYRSSRRPAGSEGK
ncbi:MAG: hypothetical protein KKB20_11960 [Proteobacteria bacterium]|nr:hypothetical protein [Pseudomonadota bacterium]